MKDATYNICSEGPIPSSAVGRPRRDWMGVLCPQLVWRRFLVWTSNVLACVWSARPQQVARAPTSLIRHRGGVPRVCGALQVYGDLPVWQRRTIVDGTVCAHELRELTLWRCRFFSSYHGHSGPRQRNRLRGSDLKILTGLNLREGDQFVEVCKIEDLLLTLNPRRDCDIGVEAGSCILLEFATAKQNIFEKDISSDDE